MSMGLEGKWGTSLGVCQNGQGGGGGGGGEGGVGGGQRDDEEEGEEMGSFP